MRTAFACATAVVAVAIGRCLDVAVANDCSVVIDCDSGQEHRSTTQEINVGDGFHLQISSRKPTYVFREPIELVFRMTNVSAKAQMLHQSSIFGTYELEVEGPDGPAPLTRYGKGQVESPWMNVGGHELKPGKFREKSIAALGRIYDMSAPGIYTITARTSVSLEEGSAKLISEPLQITIVDSAVEAGLDWPEGGEVREGVQLRARTDRKIYVRGEPIELFVDVMNRNDGAVAVDTSSFLRTYQVEVYDSQGVKMPLTLHGKQCLSVPGGDAASEDLPAHGNCTHSQGSLNRLYDMTLGGEYTIVAGG